MLRAGLLQRVDNHIALRMAPQALGRAQSPLAVFYRRIKSRTAERRAIPATAHKLACLVYRMLKYGREYVKQSMQEYEQKLRQQQERSLRRKATALGYDLVPKVGKVAESVLD